MNKKRNHRIITIFIVWLLQNFGKPSGNALLLGFRQHITNNILLIVFKILIVKYDILLKK